MEPSQHNFIEEDEQKKTTFQMVGVDLFEFVRKLIFPSAKACQRIW